MTPDAISESKILGTLILNIGVSLLNSGASCNRIRITMTRFAAAYNYSSHISIGSKSVSLSLNDNTGVTIFNGIRSIPGQGVDFKIMSAISRLSWKVAKE